MAWREGTGPGATDTRRGACGGRSHRVDGKWGPCLPAGPATPMRTSHDEAHAMGSGQGVKEKPDNYDCCALCLDRDASGQTLQGKKKRHKTTGLGGTAHTGTGHHTKQESSVCEEQPRPAAQRGGPAAVGARTRVVSHEGRRCRAEPPASGRNVCVCVEKGVQKGKQEKETEPNQKMAKRPAWLSSGGFSGSPSGSRQEIPLLPAGRPPTGAGPGAARPSAKRYIVLQV